MNREELVEAATAQGIKAAALKSTEYLESVVNVNAVPVKIAIVETLTIDEPTAAPKKQRPAKSQTVITPQGSIDAAIKQLIEATQTSAELDEDRVIELIQEHAPKPAETVRTIVMKENRPPVDLGTDAAPELEKIIRLVDAGANVWLYGEAGSGKSHIGYQVSQALNVPFYPMSICPQTTKSDLLGYTDANGNYIESPVYKPFMTGGLLLLDEIDGGNDGVLNILNSLTSNHFASFPNGTQEKNPDFRVIATGNTIGNGADRNYTGRRNIDLATRNRFIFVHIDTDFQLIKKRYDPTNEHAETFKTLDRVREQSRQFAFIGARQYQQAATLEAIGLRQREIFETLAAAFPTETAQKILNIL